MNKRVMIFVAALLLAAALLVTYGNQEIECWATKCWKGDLIVSYDSSKIPLIVKLPNFLPKEIKTLTYDPLIKRWSALLFGRREHPSGAELLEINVQAPNGEGDIYFQNCQWKLISTKKGIAKYQFKKCKSFEPVIEIPTEVTFAYCRAKNGGLSCERNNLDLYISETYIVSFIVVKGEFTEDHQRWIRQIIKFIGSDTQLPETLYSRQLYIFDLKQDN